MKQHFTKLMLALLVMVALLGQAAAVFADTSAAKPDKPRPPKPALQGQVQSVDTDAGTLTIAVPKGPLSGTWTVITTDETKYRVPDVEEATIADIAVGDVVGIHGEMDKENKTVTAKGIHVLGDKPADGPKPEHGKRVGGEITAISGTSFTLHTPKGDDLTITTDENTKYRLGRDTEITFADLQVGDKVMVTGQPVEGQEKTILATGVNVKPAQDK